MNGNGERRDGVRGDWKYRGGEMKWEYLCQLKWGYL